MFRLIVLTAGFIPLCQCSQNGMVFDDEDAALSLLQLKVDRGNTTAAHNWWRNGGCAADLADPLICAFNTDTHLSHRFAGGSTNEHRLGAQPLARTTDDSISIDAFQCAFSRGRASVCGLAIQMGDHKIECEGLSPDCHSYLYCELDGEPLTFDTFPKLTSSGLLITKTSSQVYCFDSPDGRSSVSIRSNYMNAQHENMGGSDCRERTQHQSFGRAQVGSTNWLDGQVRIEREIAVTGDQSLCGGPGSMHMPLADSLFGPESTSRLCDRTNADGAPDCENIPEPPPAPTAEEACSQGDCSFETAQRVCAPLEQHDFKYQGCLLDVCSGCDNSNDSDGDMEQIGADDVAEEALSEPGPECVDGGADCDMPGICRNAVKVSLDTVSQNNLAGAGPDAGTEEIRFTSAALVGDTVLDLVVKAVGGNYKGKASRNGKKGEFGVTSMKSGKDVELEFSFQDSTGRAVVLDSVAMSFYDLDEGKKGKSRTTLTACDATNAILTTNTELTLQRPDGCFAVSSSQHGGKANNPVAPGSLTPEQGGRSVTLVYAGVSSVKVTLALSKGFGLRNTYWSFQPSLSCLAGEASDLPLKLTEPVDMSLPSDRTCPQFVGLAQCQEGVSGERFALLMGRGSHTIGSCAEECKRRDPNYNGMVIEMYDRFAPGGVATIPTGKDSNVDNHCQCVRGCGATQAHEIGVAGSWKYYTYTMFCPPWQPWCNMDIWDECLQQKLQTDQGDGTPWTWLTAV